MDFLAMAILTGVRWYFIVDLICMSLTIGNVEHIFIVYWPSDNVFLIQCTPAPSHGWRF